MVNVAVNLYHYGISIHVGREEILLTDATLSKDNCRQLIGSQVKGTRIPLEVTSVSSEDLQPSAIHKHTQIKGNAEIFITVREYVLILKNIKKTQTLCRDWSILMKNHCFPQFYLSIYLCFNMLSQLNLNYLQCEILHSLFCL